MILCDTLLEIEYVSVHISKDLAYILSCVSAYVKKNNSVLHHFRSITTFTESTLLLALTVSKCLGFPLTRQLCNTSWMSCSLTQLWRCLSWDGVRSHGLRAQSHETVPSHSGGPQVTHSFWTTWLQIRGSHNSSSALTDLLEWLRELWETFVFIDKLIKGDDKGYRWIARCRDTRGTVWEGPKHRNVCPCGAVTLPVRGYVHSPGSSLKPLLLGFLWRLPHIDMVHFQPLSPLWRNGGVGMGVLKIRSSNHGVVFLVTSPLTQEPSGSPRDLYELCY